LQAPAVTAAEEEEAKARMGLGVMALAGGTGPRVTEATEQVIPLPFLNSKLIDRRDVNCTASSQSHAIIASPTTA
jgi:hypothetical protein